MLFELKTETECMLTSFTGRTQKEGPKTDKPAVSFNLKLASVSNTIIDMLSPTMRHTVYAPIEGQEQLPDVELTTPILRSKDLKRWQCETVHTGWTVRLARGINDGSALQMGSCKIDSFDFDFYEGGHVDLEFRISTADLDEAGAGMLWGRQKCKVFVTVEAPEIPKPAIDGSVEAFRKDHPEFNDGSQADLLSPEQALATSLVEPDDGQRGEDLDDDGSGHPDAQQPADPQRGENWPFPTGKNPEEAADQREQAELEAGMAASVTGAGLKPKRGRAAAH